MGARSDWHVTCDGRSCTARLATWFATKVAALDAARAAGWSVVPLGGVFGGERVVCPTCLLEALS